VCAAWLVCLAAAAASPVDDVTSDSSVTSAVAVGVPYAGIRDEAIMILVGTALIGLASAVRRAG
jgi:hypothetical protein